MTGDDVEATQTTIERLLARLSDRSTLKAVRAQLAHLGQPR